MPHPIKHYEVHVLRLLLKPEWTLKQLDRLLKTATTREVEYTGYGFFVSVNNPDIGRRRRVYAGGITLHWRFMDHDAGFIVFLEDNHLTLEAFPRGAEPLPANFRDGDVQITSNEI